MRPEPFQDTELRKRLLGESDARVAEVLRRSPTRWPAWVLTIPTGIAVLLAGVLVAAALVFLAVEERYQLASSGKGFVYRLNRASGNVTLCMPSDRGAVDCSGEYAH